MVLNKTSYPFFVKSALILISLISVIYIVILGKDLLSPLLFSFLFSIVLLPVANFMEKRLHFPRFAASFVSVILFMGLIALILYVLTTQIEILVQDWPAFKMQLLSSIDTLQQWISLKFHVNSSKQIKYIQSNAEQILSSGPALFGMTILSVTSILMFLIFTFLYTFFCLLYRRLILRFLIDVFKEENSKIVYDVVEQGQLIIRKYVIGIFTEMLIVVGIVSTAFVLLGIEYAVLMGIITGLFNIIPYIGILTALILSMIITFATSGLLIKVVLVMVVVISMHLIDSNILLPIVVGSRLKINAFVTVLGVVLGQMIWGISGMFLSISVIAILKIIFDRIVGLKPWGLLLGEEEKTLVIANQSDVPRSDSIESGNQN